MLWRLAMRPDGRLLAGAAGMAAAILLPLAATLVVEALQPAGADAGLLVVATDLGTGLALDRLVAQGAVSAVSFQRAADGAAHYAYVIGDPLVVPGESAVVEFDKLQGHVLVPAGSLLAHPSDQPHAPVVAALLPPGALWDGTGAGGSASPPRGSDAFEAATIQGLRQAATLLVWASVPAVLLVAVAFARQEARDHGRVAAVLAAEGGHRMARRVLLARLLGMVALAATAAAVLVLGLYKLGGPAFARGGFPFWRMAATGAVPTLAAALACLGVAAVAPSALRLLRAPPGDAPEAVPLRLPLLGRPLLLGVRLVPVLLLSGLLFAMDVGFPLAAANVPASLGGQPGEWVLGGEGGIRVGQGVADAVADVAGLDPRVQAILAETVVPTMLAGHPVVVRGGAWESLAAYHGLSVSQGTMGPHGIGLGARLAERLGVGVGASVLLQGGDRPFALPMLVQALIDGPGLLADEAFVPAAEGRALAGLASSQSTFVRFRPQTADVSSLVQRAGPAIEVTGLSMVPPEAVAGSIAHAHVGLANLGALEGTRTLVLRVAGEGVATVDVAVQGHGRTSVEIPFVVPAGPFELQVNPIAQAEGAPGGTITLQARSDGLAVELLQASGEPWAGQDVRLHATLRDAQDGARPVATGRTDAQGATFLPAGPGTWYVHAPGPGLVASGQVLLANGSVEVVAAWLEPARPVPGELATLAVTARNPGATRAGEVLEAKVDGRTVQVVGFELEPGGTSTVAAAIAFEPGAARLLVGGFVLDLAPAPAPGAALDPLRPDPVGGGAVQGQVARRVLGDARGTLLMLGGVALASSLTVVALATARALRARRHVAGAWIALGRTQEQVRSRAALEAGWMGGLCMAVVLLPAKLAFVLLESAASVTVFAHTVPDPIGWLFALQCTAAFATACALTAYSVAGRVLPRLR